MLRDAVAEGTPLGLRAKEVMARGDLVEDEVILGLIEESLEGIAGSGFVLDGFPRTLAQAKGLDDMLDRRSERLDCVILLTADTEVVVKRMVGRGREDDTPETVRHRLEVYENSTRPLIGYYEPKEILRRVDGVGEIQEIHERIESALVG
jgi:adenylate kinase